MGITWVIKCRGTRKEKRFPWGIFQGLLLAVWDSVCWLTAQEKRSATWASPTHPVSLSVSATHTHNTLCKISWAAPFSFQVTAADRTRQSQGIPLLSLFSGDVYFFFQYNKSPSSFCPVSSSPALTISTFPLCSLMFLRSLSTTNSTDMLPIHPSFIILLLRLAVYLHLPRSYQILLHVLKILSWPNDDIWCVISTGKKMYRGCRVQIFFAFIFNKKRCKDYHSQIVRN